MKNHPSKKTLALLMGLLAATALPSCVKKDPERYYDEKTGFSIKFPKDWEVKVRPFQDVDVFGTSPKEDYVDTFQEIVGVSHEKLPGSVTMDDYYQAAVKGLSKEISNVKVLEEGRARIGMFQEARWLVYTGEMYMVEAKCLAYVFLRGRRAYVVTAIAMPNKFDKFRPQFEQIARSFRPT